MGALERGTRVPEGYLGQPAHAGASVAAVAVRDLLVVVDRTLAKAAIEEAESAGEVTTKDLSKAADELAKGDDAAADGRLDKAIEHYRKAWQRLT